MKVPLAIEHKDYLKVLSKSKSKKRREHLIDAGSTNEIKSILECIENIMSGHVQLSASDLKKLKRYKKTLRFLCLRCRKQDEKRAVLKQRGGFLQFLLPIALSALGSLAKKVLS